jgi:hypothetical protein
MWIMEIEATNVLNEAAKVHAEQADEAEIGAGCVIKINPGHPRRITMHSGARSPAGYSQTTRGARRLISRSALVLYAGHPTYVFTGKTCRVLPKKR